MASQTLVLNYSRKLRDIEPLWFASIANNILWWTFVKACARTIYAGVGEPFSPSITLSYSNRFLCACMQHETSTYHLAHLAS
jgi:hypothetical protein